MADGTTFVGLDVHLASIAVAVIRPNGDAQELGTIPNTSQALAKRLQKLGEPSLLSVCYEAGPCGYAIYRQLTERGISCTVVAPSLIPKRPGDRIKTDRKDALKLARLLRSDDLTPVAVPTPDLEALRELSRARQTAMQDLHRERQRLAKLLHRAGITEPVRCTRWSKAWWGWADALTLPQPAAQLVLAERRRAVRAAEEVRDRLTDEVTTAAASCPQAGLIADLRQLYGVGVLTAVGVVVEVGDLTRFAHPSHLMAYAGMVPSEHSSGGRQQRGSITKTGNAHLRYLLVEAAWHARRPVPPVEAPPTTPLAKVTARARTRLHDRYWSMVGRGKPAQVAAVAVARELLGFVWAVGQLHAGRPLAEPRQRTA